MKCLAGDATLVCGNNTRRVLEELPEMDDPIHWRIRTIFPMNSVFFFLLLLLLFISRWGERADEMLLLNCRRLCAVGVIGEGLRLSEELSRAGDGAASPNDVARVREHFTRSPPTDVSRPEQHTNPALADATTPALDAL